MKAPMHISDVLAETFRHQPTPENLTAWVDNQPMPGQMELSFEDEIASEFITPPCFICGSETYDTGNQRVCDENPTHVTHKVM